MTEWFNGRCSNVCPCSMLRCFSSTMLLSQFNIIQRISF